MDDKENTAESASFFTESNLSRIKKPVQKLRDSKGTVHENIHVVI